MVVSACVRKIDAGARALISPSKHAFTALALRASGTMHDDLLRLQDLANAHGNGLLRDILEAGEPSFSKLLPSASLVQR